MIRAFGFAGRCAVAAAFQLTGRRRPRRLKALSVRLLE